MSVNITAPANCQDAPETTPSNAGVAGAGILLSFIITAGFSLILSGSVILSEFLAGRSSSISASTIRRKLLSGYSDSQILQGIGIQSVALAQVNTLVPYHFFLVWMLGLLSMATHNATLLALARDYRRDWVIRWLRQALMFVNLSLSTVLGVYILQAVSTGLDNETLPMACVWADDADPEAANGAPSDAALSYVGTVAVMVGNGVIFGLATWYLHSRRQRFYRIIQTVGLMLMAAIAIGAAVRIIILSQAFGNPSVELSDQGETQWSFGQLLSLLVLFFPLVSVIEIARGELTVAPLVEDDLVRLNDAELQENPKVTTGFQPNPYFGSETNLFKR